MPNIKSAKKRVLVTEKKTEQNKAIRSEFKTEVKRVETLIAENKIAEAKAALPHAFAVIDSAASKNIIHENNAANKKARLSKKLSEAEKAAPAKVEAPVEEVKPEPVAEEPAVEVPVKKTATRKTAAKKAEDGEVAPKKAPAKRTAKKKEADAE